MAQIEIENLNYSYPEKGYEALKNIGLDIEQGEFVLIIGGSGSGKSSLIRAMAGLIPEFYGGNYNGDIRIDNVPIGQIERRAFVQKVGMVFQDPESQLVMTTPEEEIAFGLENIEMDGKMMFRRIVEVSSALSLSTYKSDFIPELSGGQKQKVALASVLAMHPEILLLDEPTSQLDPIAGEEILTMVRRLNEENGMTIVLVEQKLERCFHLADRILLMEEGKIILDSKYMGEAKLWMALSKKPFIPPLSKLFATIDSKKIPVTVKEGRKLLRQWQLSGELSSFDLNKSEEIKKEKNVLFETALEIKNLWFSYPNGGEILKDINLSIKKGSFTVIIGENGCGKTTLLKQINGLLKPNRGKVSIYGEDSANKHVEDLSMDIGYLSQNPNDYLFLPTVLEEVLFTAKNLGVHEVWEAEDVLKKLDIEQHKNDNPRDLSVGQRQKVALASILVAKPRFLLLDEPTRGLDYLLKDKLGELLKELQKEGTTIIMITHDIEFAAKNGEDIILLDDGRVVDQGSKYKLLTQSTFYSTQISRLFSGYHNKVLTVEDGEKLLKKINE